MQAIQLITEFKDRHKGKLSMMKDLLALVKFLLPDNSFPGTMYRLRKILRAALNKVLDVEGYFELHLCHTPKCMHVYFDDDDEECPVCRCAGVTAPRYKVLQNKKRVPHHVLRYLGVARGVRTLLLNEHVCKAVESFDLDAAVVRPQSVYGSEVTDHICRVFIPDWDALPPDRQLREKARFFRTGQVLDDRIKALVGGRWQRRLPAVQAPPEEHSALWVPPDFGRPCNTAQGTV